MAKAATAKLTVGLAVIAVLGSCSSPRLVSDKDFSELTDAADRVSDASSALSDDVSRFDDEDWQDVVPDVRQHQQELDAAQDDLQSAIAEMKNQ